MRNAILILAVTGILGMGASESQAHVPDRCRRLFTLAGKATQEVVRKNEKVRALVNRLEPSRARHYNWFDEFERLANATSNLLRAMTYQYLALDKAIKCVARQGD